MIRVFSFILFVIISNNVFANVIGEVLICNKDTRGYNFINSDTVEVLDINLKKINIISTNYSYQLEENAIIIKKLKNKFNKEKETIGWIFRRTLDYVSLDYVNGDLSRKFLWSCEITSSDKLEKRLKDKIYSLIKPIVNKMKEFN